MNKERIDKLKEFLPKSGWEINVEEGYVKTKSGICSFVNSKGYIQTSNRKIGAIWIHEVIALVGGLDILDKTINHIDCNKLNNKISNLEAISAIENTRHAVENGLMVGHKGSSNGNSILTEKEVREIKRLIKTNEHTLQAIADIFKVSRDTIKRIKSGQLWKHITI